jgi:hypothetical protein
VAWGNSSVEAWENSSVVAWGNSSVEAWGNSSVVARGNSSVVAWGNSSVVAWENVCVRLSSVLSNILLYGFCVCYVLNKIKNFKIELKSKTAQIIQPKTEDNLDEWLENQSENKDKVILFKRVSKDLKTQENTRNETQWKIGELINHPNWKPEIAECGEGKFHCCSRPYFCDEFRTVKDDKYIAIEIEKSDLFHWKNAEYPHKIAFRAGKVLYQCDKFGRKIENV